MIECYQQGDVLFIEGGVFSRHKAIIEKGTFAELLLFENRNMESTYMVIERYKAGAGKTIYQRLLAKGRMMPFGLVYVDSWVTKDLDCCFQVIKSENVQKIEEWIAHWHDLIDFEVIPVTTSHEAKSALL